MKKPWLFVLAGGSGTRFWPRSRAARPKQFLPIAGTDPLLVTTIRRFLSWIPSDQIVVVTTIALETESRRMVASLGGVTVLAEPEAKNTGPSLLMAMEWLRAKDPDGTAVVVPADHWITDEEEYLGVMKQAVDAAIVQESLCTIGIQPTRPETGYGYIRSGDSVEGGALKVARFVEKPSREVAETMVQDPEYLWNSGMFVWRCDVFFREMQASTPSLVKAFECYRSALSSGGAPAALSESFSKAQAISIDYALLEKSKNVLVVPGSTFGWNDLGSFLSLGEVYEKTEGGVARAERVLALDSLANIIDAPGKTVALLGVTDMVIVDTGDVILVAAKERSQEVKKIVERLKAEGKSHLL